MELDKSLLEEIETIQKELKSKKMTAVDVVISRFLDRIKDEGVMPWQRPYKCYASFNSYSGHVYRGINRWVLPRGEYMTKNNINEYNKKNGTNYKFRKGITWYPVLFWNVTEKELKSDSEEYQSVKEYILGEDDLSAYFLGKEEGRCKFYSNKCAYIVSKNKIFKIKYISRYSLVANISDFVDEEGNSPKSKIDDEEVTLTYSEPRKIVESYIKRTGVGIRKDSLGAPYYSDNDDCVHMNTHMSGEDEYWSTLFHELAHSTGIMSRLNRDCFYKYSKQEFRSQEECVAELTASLCCSECNIGSFNSSNLDTFENSVAYVKSWIRFISKNKSMFYKAITMADEAFNYMLNGEDESDLAI